VWYADRLELAGVISGSEGGVQFEYLKIGNLLSSGVKNLPGWFVHIFFNYFLIHIIFLAENEKKNHSGQNFYGLLGFREVMSGQSSFPG
jgi:hypothetical protein